MAMHVPISSVCGSVHTTIDWRDADLNPHGVICCDACRSIIATRESWAEEYDFAF